jgi:glycosyltransferase involved in cell wall biosynthesis
MSTWPHNLPYSQPHPPVSIVTPTYNRNKFIPFLIETIKAQTYPKERIEWLLFDDGDEKIEEIIKPYMSELNIRYFTSDVKLTIGQKRNKLHEEARGDIIVVFDDDDYSMPERISYSVQTLLSKKVDMCGCSQSYMYFTDEKKIYEAGPYTSAFGPNHATFGTMAYTKAYVLKHACNETKTFAEESEFTNMYKQRLYQLDPRKVMIVICHSQNTFNKDKMRDGSSLFVKKTGLNLKSFIRDKKLRDFYASA